MVVRLPSSRYDVGFVDMTARLKITSSRFFARWQPPASLVLVVQASQRLELAT